MTFDTVFNRLLINEGNYSFDPNDPGGETRWGISKRAYPNLIIKKLTREDAYNIYKRDFWNILEMDDYFTGAIRFQLFDFAINSGIQTAIRYLQRAIGVADDGYWGPISKEAISKFSETDIIMKLNAERLDYMTRLSGWTNFSKGWARRISQNLKWGATDS